jgi:spermidine synthase/MFS family permease
MSATVTTSAATAIPLPVGRLAGVGAVVLFANASLLVLQLVATRLLFPFIGSSLETWTAIIGVFLTGIALGNGYGGRIADRYPSPRTLSLLLAGGAAAAGWMLLFPLLLDATGVHKSLPLVVRIPLLAALLCLPAGFVLSLLTPLAIKLGLPDVNHTGRVTGLIFALSTLGCLSGNYLTGFYLIPTVTSNAIVVVAASLLVLLAVVALLLPKTRISEAITPDLPAASNPIDSGVKSANPHAFPDIRQAYVIVFFASFCGMTLELTGSRLLAQPLGVSLFTWTGIIGVMLAGTAAGNFVGGLIADLAARPDATLSPRVVLGATLILAGASTVFLFVAMAIITQLQLFETWAPIPQVMGWTFSMFFLPMFLLGLISPQVIRLAVPDTAHIGRVAGRIYAWSTAGAIVGTFSAGYLLLSEIGAYNTINVVALVLTLTSLLVVNIWSDTRAAIKADGKKLAYNAAGAGALLYLFSIVLGGVTGGFILATRERDQDVIATVESNYYTIKVSRSRYAGVPETALNLNLDRLLHSIVDPYDPTFLYYTHEYVQVEFVRLARTTVPEPRVLVIGGGGYTFPRYLMERIPECHVDVVEIDPKVTWVAYEHLGLKSNPHLNSIHMDGRQFVSERATPGSYQLVVQDAVNDLSVPAHLMTREYNDAIKAVLEPKGVYLLTIIDCVATGKLWKAAMATLKKSFEHVLMLRVPAAGEGTAWYESRTVLVIYASDRPLNLDALRAAAPDQLHGPEIKELVPFAVGTVELPGAGPGFVARFGPAEATPIYTHIVPPELLQQFTDREKGIVLTDQFCPVDNLMAEVFRTK